MADEAGGRTRGQRLIGRCLIGLTVVAALAGCTLINYAPTAEFTFGPAGIGVAPQAVTFNALLSTDDDGHIVSYDWDFGDGTFGMGDTVGHTYTEAGTYTVILTVTDNGGATNTATGTVTIEAGPVASFTAAPSAGRSPLPVYFNAEASSYDDEPLSYSWDFGDGTTASGVIATHLYQPYDAQTYTVILTVRTHDGHTATAAKQIHVTARITATCGE